MQVFFGVVLCTGEYKLPMTGCIPPAVSKAFCVLFFPTVCAELSFLIGTPRLL